MSAKEGNTIAQKHGAFSFRARGEKALEPAERSRLQELKETVHTRDGALSLMQERAANAIMLVEILTAYAAKEHAAGTPIENIKVLGYLPAYMNTCQRMLKDLLQHMPKDDSLGVIDLEELRARYGR
jgi:hypothetical protein